MKPDQLDDQTGDQIQKHYDDVFRDIAGAPDNVAFGDQAEQAANDDFYYSGDPERREVANLEKGKSLVDPSVGQNEIKTALGGEATKPKSLMNRAKGIFTSKKKLAAAGGLAAGGGLVIAILFLFMLMASGLSTRQLSTVLETYAFGRMHLANYRRSSQYLVEESLNDAVAEGGKVNALGKPTVAERLGRYDANKMLTNLGENGELKFNFADKETGWIRTKTTSELKSITIGEKEIPLPERSRFNPIKNYSNNTEFINSVDQAVSETGLLAEESRWVRTKAANSILEAADIKLYRWQDAGRSVKSFKDSVLSAYERMKGKKINSSIAEVNNASDNYDAELATALEATDDVERAGAIASSESIKKAASTASEIAGKVSLAALVATLYCGARDYVGNAQEVADSKATTSKKSAALLSSAAHQGPEATATAVDNEGRRIEGFETSYAYQKAVGVPQSMLANKEPDIDGGDLPVVDSSSPVYMFFSVVKTAGDSAFSGATFGADQIPGLKTLTEGAKDKGCSAITSPAGQVILVVGEVLITAISAGLTGGAAGAGEVAAKEGTEAAVTEAFKFSVSGFAKAFTKSIAKDAVVQGGMALGLYVLFSQFSGTDTPATQTSRHATGIEAMGYGQLANEGTGDIGGRPLSDGENSQVQTMITQRRLAKLHNKPLWYRLASLSNPYSPASQFAATYPNNPTSFLKKARAFAQTSLNPVATLSHGYGQVASATMTSSAMVYAASDDTALLKNAGVQPIGFSTSELTKMTQPDFWPRANAKYVETGDRLKTMDAAYKPCYEQLASKRKMDSDCQTKLSTDEALHYRLYKMDGGLSDAPADGSDENSGLLGDYIDLQTVTEDDDTGGSTTVSGSTPSGIIGIDQTAVTSNGGGIRVYKGIVSQVEKMIAAASASGVQLTGGGWRDPAEQIRLRQAHCGTSHYDVYEKPSSQCRPPTARPGTSNHERGLAIDFRNCDSHSTACWQWLNKNAAGFGFYNLKSEPWHWSTNGG